MKYETQNLQKLKSDCAEIAELLEEINQTLNRSVIIKTELETLDEKLKTPERTEEDIANHATLLKQYSDLYADEPARKLLKLCKEFCGNLEEERRNTVNLIKRL